METTKLFDAEWNLMCFVWANQRTSASQAAAFALQELGWKKNTTYTVIKRLIEKKVLRRDEPGFEIVPLVSKEQVQQAELQWVLNKRFGGEKAALLATLDQLG